MDVTDNNFQTAVIERSHTVPVVVDFWAEWCGPCRQLGPVIERAVAARAGKIELAKLDTDANPTLSRLFQIQSIPAVKAFRDGKVAAEFVGAQPPAAVERAQQAPEALQEAFAALDAGDREHALDLLLGALGNADGARDDIRRVIVGILDELGVDDPLARESRRRLAAALY